MDETQKWKKQVSFLLELQKRLDSIDVDKKEKKRIEKLLAEAHKHLKFTCPLISEDIKKYAHLIYDDVRYIPKEQ